MFCPELIDPRHFFYNEVTNDVPRNGCIHYKSEENNDGKGDNNIGESLMVKTVTMSDKDNPSVHVTEPTERLNMNDQTETLVSLSQSSQTRSKSKEVSYKDLQEIYTELMRLSIAQGKAKTLYGAGIHLLDVLKLGDTNFDEELDDTICRYSSTFTKTSQVTFLTLSQEESFRCPQKLSTKPS